MNETIVIGPQNKISSSLCVTITQEFKCVCDVPISYIPPNSKKNLFNLYTSQMHEFLNLMLKPQKHKVNSHRSFRTLLVIFVSKDNQEIVHQGIKL